jgi:hypothetical protein
MPVTVYVKMLNLVIANANSMFLDVLYSQKPTNCNNLLMPTSIQLIQDALLYLCIIFYVLKLITRV